MKFKIAFQYDHCKDFWFSFNPNTTQYEFVAAGDHLEVFYENDWMQEEFKGNLDDGNEIEKFVRQHLQHFDQTTLIEMAQAQNGEHWTVYKGFVTLDA